jgi:hypothetical protein
MADNIGFEIDYSQLPDQGSPLSQSLKQVVNSDPNTAAEQIRLARSLNTSVADVAANQSQARQFAMNPTPDRIAQIERDYPGTAKFLINPENAVVSRDNLDNMVKTEGILSKMGTSFKEGSKDVVKNTTSFFSGLFSTLAEKSVSNRENIPPEYQQWYDVGGREKLQNAGTFFGDVTNAELLKEDPRYKEMYANSSTVQKYVMDVARNSPQIATQIAAYAAGGAPIATGVMFAQIAGGDYKNLKEQGVGTERAFTAGVVDAAIQAPLEQFSLGKLTRLFKPTSPTGIKVKEMATVLGTEFATEFIQQYPQAAAEIYAKSEGKSNEERIQMFIDDFANITRDGLYSGAISVPFSLVGGGAKVLTDAQRAKRAQTTVEGLQELGDVVAQSKLKERLPQAQESFLKEVKQKSGIDSVFVSADELIRTLAQSGQDLNEIKGDLGIDENQITEATATGAPLQIPLEKFVTKFAGTEQYKTLLDTAKFEVDGMSNRDAKEYLSSIGEQTDQNNAETQAAQAKVEANDYVYNQVYTSLISVGYSKQEAATNATLAAKMFDVAGTKSGQTGKELYDQRPIKVQRREINNQEQGGFESFIAAISGQESGGNYDAVNSRTGAAGKYQIMPDNWPSWSVEAGLPEGSPMTPENQEVVARFKLKQYYDKYGARGAAIAWYAGEGAINYSEEALSRKQGNGDEPSINEYADSILGRMGNPQSTSLNQYAGTNAETADTDQLDQARQLEIKGADMEAIRQETGWHKGMDNKWRFEIDDSKATLIDVDSKVSSLEKQLKTTMRQASKMADGPEKQQLLDRADSIVAEAETVKSATLGNVLNHPSLYKAYPAIADTKVVFSKMSGGENGAYHASTNTIEINSSLSPDKTKETLLHEIQHVIQNNENFARGGNPSMFRDLDVTDSEMKKLDKEISKTLAENKDYARLYRESNQLYLKSKERELTTEEEKRQSELTEQMANFESVDLKIFNLESQKYRLQEDRKILSPNDQYQRLAGEVEARDTASRANLTPEQRRLTAPNMPDDAIVVWNGKEMAYTQQPPIIRGNIAIGDNQAVITLTPNADRSTFIHEMSHYFFENLAELSAMENAPDQALKDVMTVINWAGYDKPFAELSDTEKTLVQEKFATGFEKYLMDGKAPTNGLLRAFRMFKNWLIKVYQRGIGQDVSLEVREVMDRMVATEEEIAQAEQMAEYRKLFVVNPEELSHEERAKYDKFIAEAKAEAEEILLAEKMQEIERQQSEEMQAEREKATNQITDELKQDPVYLAIDQVSADFKKDAKSVAKRYADSKMKLDEELHFEFIAEANGFSSGDELAQIITAANKFDVEVSARVDNHMKQFFPLQDPTNIQQAALKALHNDSQLDRLAYEREIFAEKWASDIAKQGRAAERKQVIDAAKEMAKTIVAAKPYSEIKNVGKYFAAERSAAVKAARALQRKEYEAAQTFKEQQILNHAIAIEVLKTKLEMDKAQRYLAKMQKKSDKQFHMPPDFRDQISALLDRFGFGRKGWLDIPHDEEQDFGRRPLVDWQKIVQNENMDVLVISDALLAETYRKSFNDMSIEEIRDLRDGIKSIEHVGIQSSKFLAAFNKELLEDKKEELLEALNKNVKKKAPKSLLSDSALTTRDKIKRFLENPMQSLDNALLTMQSMADYLDGFDPNGPWHDILVKTPSKAWSDEMTRFEGVMKQTEITVSKYYGKDQLVKMNTKPEFIQAINDNLTKWQRIMIGLNLGNEQNMRRVRDNFKWTDEQVSAVVATLTDNDWKFVQETWDNIDQLWPDIRNLTEEITGVAPKKVEAKEYTTPTGATLRGGYFPIMYDPKLSTKAAEIAEQKSLAFTETPFFMASTRHGFTKQRAGKVTGKPLRTDPFVISDHYTNVIHDLTHRKAVRDIAKVLRDKDIQNALVDRFGVDGYRTMQNWLKGIAADQTETLTGIDKALRWLRVNTVLSTMAVNFRVALMQLTGYFYAIPDVGLIPTMRSSIDYLTTPGAEKAVSDKSTFMRNRAKVIDRDIRENVRRMFEKENKLRDNAYYITVMADKAVTYPLWYKAYTQGLGQNMSESDAISYADGIIIKTQSSGLKKDLPAFMRGGELKKLLSMYYSFGNALYNLYRRQFMKAEQAPSSTEKAQHIAALVFYLWLLPGTTEFAIREMFRNSDDDDPEKRMKRYLTSIATGPFQSVPVARDAASYFFSGVFGVRNDFALSPVENTITTVLDAGKMLFDDKEREPKKAAESIARAAAYTIPFPQQINTIVFNIIDYLDTKRGEMDYRDFVSRRNKDRK